MEIRCRVCGRKIAEYIFTESSTTTTTDKTHTMIYCPHCGEKNTVWL